MHEAVTGMWRLGHKAQGMEKISRYAVYYAPRPGAFADTAARWLGWDAVAARAVVQPAVGFDLAGITADPARYGFHGTLRAPFRALAGVDVGAAVAALAARLAPVVCKGLRLEDLEGYLALTPMGCEAALLDLAAAAVEGTEPLRAPLTAAEVARRRPEALSGRQRALLAQWGYPFVMEEFRFHLTLTGRLEAGRLEAGQAGPVAGAVAAAFGPVLPRPLVIEDLCLFGEAEVGRFRLLHRYPLAG